ncbi:bifunctional oligoribonuclease/PAP phosphatase NrnA [bacterium]|nr:bifunctional oligoribonuclease/PAP phosphatase NrnA [bacterium]
MEMKFENLIKESKHILIISHVNPDGDTLGSMCAMYNAILKRYKKTAEMLVPSHIPQIYNFIPAISNAKMIADFDKSREYDLVITVDVAALDRILDAQILFSKARHTINIDHHQTNIGFGEVNFVEPFASSTGEVIFKLFERMNWEINKDTADALYTSILTDTGGFRFENTTSDALEVASKLVKLGVVPKEIYNSCYESKTRAVVMFQNYVVANAQFTEDGKIAYSFVSKKDLERFKVKDSSTDGIPEVLRSIVTTEVSFVLKEIDTKMCKASMRSKHIDVSKVCEAFGGGGHKFAAGCTIKYPLKEAAKKLIQEIEKVSNDASN